MYSVILIGYQTKEKSHHMKQFYLEKYTFVLTLYPGPSMVMAIPSIVLPLAICGPSHFLSGSHWLNDGRGWIDISKNGAPYRFGVVSSFFLG